MPRWWIWTLALAFCGGIAGPGGDGWAIRAAAAQPAPPGDTPATDPHVITVPNAPQARPKLPAVIRPGGSDLPEGGTGTPEPITIRPPAPPHPAGVSGTGFFIRRDGSLLTVAHVVPDCRSIAVVSRYLAETPAELVARDPDNDVAVLRAVETRPPAVLALAEPPTGDEALTLFGFPNDGDTLVPTRVPGRLRLQHPAFTGIDRPNLIWMDGDDVREGFSGGPVLNASGQAIGLISGHVVHRLTVGGTPIRDTKYVYGASRRAIDMVLNQYAPAVGPDSGQAAAPPDADKAVVHILCRH